MALPHFISTSKSRMDSNFIISKIIQFEIACNVISVIPYVAPLAIGSRYIFGISQLAKGTFMLACASLCCSKKNESWKDFKAREIKVLKHGAGNFLRGLGEFLINRYLPYGQVMMAGLQIARAYHICSIEQTPVGLRKIYKGFQPLYPYSEQSKKSLSNADQYHSESKAS